ncbi:MAG: hypothetical protein LUD72_10125 [Bacteroidales bacterium]|nr:hypothetical protein [Bacteroidales bacterium]
MKIVKDRELTYDSDLYDVILVGMGLRWSISGRFQWRMATKYPEIIAMDRSGGFNDHRRLGTRKTIEGNPTISLMYYYRKMPVGVTKPSVIYEALEKCLTTANTEFKGKKVATLIAGATRYDGKGDREKCLDLLKRCMNDVDLYVYDCDVPSAREDNTAAKEFMSALRKTKPKGFAKYDKMTLAEITSLQQRANEKKQRREELAFVEL